MISESRDPYREYPWRLFGYANALVRPLRDFIPKPAYQTSLGIMHLYFLANSYDYALRVDGKSTIRSGFDCYSWHCISSWVGPALLVDNVRRLCTRVTGNRYVPVGAAYVGLFLTAPLLDRVVDWYFYRFWSAGSKSRPQLSL